MPTVVKQTLGAPATKHGDAANTTHRRLLRTRQRIREYETLVAKQVKPPRVHRRIEILARKLQHETRNQTDIDEELERLTRAYRRHRRDSWRKWQRENLVKQPGRIFAWCKRNAPDPGPGDLHWGKCTSHLPSYSGWTGRTRKGLKTGRRSSTVSPRQGRPAHASR